jgi:hypothetical protein
LLEWRLVIYSVAAIFGNSLLDPVAPAMGTGIACRGTDDHSTATHGEVVPDLVELEVAVPRLSPALR